MSSPWLRTRVLETLRAAIWVDGRRSVSRDELVATLQRDAGGAEVAQTRVDHALERLVAEGGVIPAGSKFRLPRRRRVPRFRLKTFAHAARLPPGVLSRALDFIDARSLAHCERASPRWRDIATSENRDTWRRLCLAQ